MSENKIWENIARKMDERRDPADDNELNEWLSQKKQNHTILKYINEMWESKWEGKEIAGASYSKLIKRIHKHEHHSRRFIWKSIVQGAAVVVIVFATIFIYSQIQEHNTNTQLSYQTITVPKGNRTHIELPDGTNVWLNNDTKFKYPTQFADDSRNVNLTGEAYFEVAHNAEVPFYVNIGKHRIKVLGTKFTVCAYPEDNLIETALISGKVQFEIRSKKQKDVHVLTPGNSLSYNTYSKELLEKTIDSDFLKYWTTGIYEFNDESFENLAKKIYRIYNISIVFEDEFLKSKTYTGSLGLEDNIFTFMEAIKRTTKEPIEYKYDDNRFYIKLKKTE
ncbi:FecR family protein [Puteibacter caeruleilacunae]|nr:FecR family protein [Puteibacter caeruleilacunae]